MAEPIALYVDIINNNNTSGQTENSKMIFENLNKIDPLYATETANMLAVQNAGAVIFGAGRYLCLVSMSLDNHKAVMFIEDLNKNEELAKRKASIFGNPTYSKEYMKAFFLLNDSYEEEYYDFIIRLTH